MHIFRVLPILSLLLGAHASPVDSSDEASHRLDVRATVSQVCYPTSIGGVASGVDTQTVCACVPFTGVLGDLITDGEFVTLTNLLALFLNPGTQGCAYPEYGVPACTTTTPCAYTCLIGVPSTGSNGLPACVPPST